VRIVNKKALFNYEISDKLEAGIKLSGSEAKSARLGQVSMDGAYAREMEGELWLVNMHIHPYKYADNTNYDPTRRRKLLVSQKERIAIESKMKQSRLTLVPISLYTKGPMVKIELGLARGKKKYEKREAIKRKDEEMAEKRGMSE
jgi:SsrA-binding protein